MSGKKIMTMVLLVLTIFLAGCGGPRSAAITGVIEHSHSMTLAAGTVVTVQIMDTTKQGSPGKKIAEEVIKDQEIGIPMPFAVTYDVGRINPDHAYSISVRVEDGEGKLLYTSRGEVPVITKGNPTHDIDINIILSDGG